MTVTDEAIEKIKGMIVSGALGPGDRLPRESELATELGLSRNSLREAVRALALIRVLDVRQGDGTYVTSLDPQVLLTAMSFVVDFHRDDTVLELLAVRRILEPAATALAGTRIAVAELDALESELDTLESELAAPAPEPSVGQLVAADLEFHRRIAAASGNSVLGSLLDGLAGPHTRARVWQGLTRQEAVGRTLHEHRQILAALRTGDAEAARSWSTVHIAGVEQWLRAAL
ncbi:MULTISPECIES: FadR/GntR family transcriptional regulator [Streptomyces]|uniref:GntR family transcriptional regulator n=1 Tax=Streptomyces qinglanensis TaxID=943816 RepID=A0A1E7K3U2_9ACTN|nr:MULTISPECIES: FadR/GntR family transcriptional regulator [Streptomyces]MBE9499405.1 FadR family transcriptional regulator [Streptomyces sp. GKU 257-1]OEU98593.1 GntR family transcriptional regulator [Streptomyces qinglanensis]OEV08787.1 GntR family transcriptional regulator [Streptomyces nanshensis]